MFPLISLRDIVSINALILILKIAVSVIKTRTSVFKISAYIITSITNRHTGLATILAIMFVSTFKTAVILYVEF